MACDPQPRQEDLRRHLSNGSRSSGILIQELGNHRYGAASTDNHESHYTSRGEPFEELASSMNEDLDQPTPTSPINVPLRCGQNIYRDRDYVSEENGATQSPPDQKQTSIRFAPRVRLERDEQPLPEERLPKLSVSTRQRGRSILDELAKKRSASGDGRGQDSVIRNASSVQQTVPQTVPEEKPKVWSLTSSIQDQQLDKELTVPTENQSDVYASPTTYTPMSGSPPSAASSWLSRYGSSRQSPFRRRSQRSGAGSLQGSSAASFLRQYSRSSVSSSAPDPDAEGQEIGEYILGKEIGKGGFSIVREAFLGSDPSSRPTIAVKIIRKQITGLSEVETEEIQSLFEQEIQLWRCLDHENILQFRDTYSTRFATFAFMPLAANGSLFDAVRAVRNVGLDLDQVRAYAAQVAEALRYLHKDVCIVHRDLKLENCLLLSNHDVNTVNSEYFNPIPRVVLADFGLANYLPTGANSVVAGESQIPDGSSSPKTPQSEEKGGPPGSIHYAAPETLHPPKGRQPPLSAQPDMWAFGVMLYAMITGKRPFNDSFELKLIESIKSGDWDKALLDEKVKGTSSDSTQQGENGHFDQKPKGKVVKTAHGCKTTADPAISNLTNKMAAAGIVGNEDWARSCNTIIVSDGIDPDAISEVVKGCLTTDPSVRWEIGKVVESAWLAPERKLKD